MSHIEIKERSTLENALDEITDTLLIYYGKEATKNAYRDSKICDLRIGERVFYIQFGTIVDDTEKTDWFKNTSEVYVILCNGGTSIEIQGSVSDFYTEDGEFDCLEFRKIMNS